MPKSIYNCLIESGNIKKITDTKPIIREREKSCGYMWSGEREIEMTNGDKFIFSMWHHYEQDPGENWKPTEKEILYALRPRFVTINNKMYDATWHTVYYKNDIYGSIKGFSHEINFEKNILKKIKNGTWKYDEDIVKLF